MELCGGERKAVTAREREMAAAAWKINSNQVSISAPLVLSLSRTFYWTNPAPVSDWATDVKGRWITYIHNWLKSTDNLTMFNALKF